MSEVAKAEIAFRERQGASPDHLGGSHPPARRRPYGRDRRPPEYARLCTRQAPSGADQAQTDEMGSNLAPARRTKTVDHDSILVQQKGD
ncbi:hypothetical protein [Brevundimonas bullata]|uniref:hypothetical protein n=1 Tax=Brevundimonas bullata TaxID=13160 RepID=UPI003D9A2AAD